MKRTLMTIAVLIACCVICVSASWDNADLTIDATELADCSHDKLRVKVEADPWMMSMRHDEAPGYLTYRSYVCKKCKIEILILQAIERKPND